MTGAFCNSYFSFQPTDPLSCNRITKSRSRRAETHACGSLTQRKLYAWKARMRLWDLLPTTKPKTATQDRTKFSRNKFFALKVC